MSSLGRSKDTLPYDSRNSPLCSCVSITLPATVKHELLRREEATGLYRSRIAAAILTRVVDCLTRSAGVV